MCVGVEQVLPEQFSKEPNNHLGFLKVCKKLVSECYLDQIILKFWIVPEKFPYHNLEG